MPPDRHIGRYSNFRWLRTPIFLMGRVPFTRRAASRRGSDFHSPAPKATARFIPRQGRTALTFVTGDPRSAAQGWSAPPGHESFIVTGSDLPTEKERPGGSLAAGTSSWRERPGPVNRSPVTHTVETTTCQPVSAESSGMRSRRSGTHPTASVRLSPQGGGTSVPPGPWWPAAKCGAGPCWHGVQEGPRRAERLPRTCR